MSSNEKLRVMVSAETLPFMKESISSVRMTFKGTDINVDEIITKDEDILMIISCSDVNAFFFLGCEFAKRSKPFQHTLT